MEIFYFILDDDYELFFNSISSNSFDNIIQLINDEFENYYKGNYQKVKGAQLEIIMNRTRNYVFRRKINCLKYYVGVKQSEYMSGMPCIKCSLNKPCELCELVTPFDIFKIDKAENRFLYSCRRAIYGENKHMCLLCYAKVGNHRQRSPLYN